MNEDTHVYCSLCKHYITVKDCYEEDTPCRHSCCPCCGCDCSDAEDSKPFRERPNYEIPES